MVKSTRRYRSWDKILVPKIPHSRLNHKLDWLVIVLLRCTNVKATIYEDMYASPTKVNDLLRQNWSLNACLLPFFYRCLLLALSIWFVKFSLKTQHNHWLWLKAKHLFMRPNQQADPYFDIKILVPKTPSSRLNHTLDWLVIVLL